MEIPLVLVAVVSLVAGVLLDRKYHARRSQKYTHTSARIVYWIENDMVVFANPDTGFSHAANIEFLDQYVFKHPITIWNGEYGDQNVRIVVDWDEHK